MSTESTPRDGWRTGGRIASRRLAVTVRRRGSAAWPHRPGHGGAQIARAQRDDLLTAAVAAAEDVRSRIASTLHDGPVQTLTAATWHLQRLSSLMAADDLDTARRLTAKLRADLEEVIGELRHTMADLQPPLFQGRGLEEALRAHVLRLDPSIQCSVSVEFAAQPGSTVETILYRVAQEALTNIAKHAEAKHVTVRLAESEGELTLEVSDDGLGFDVKRALRRLATGEHLGLVTMRERILGLRGTFEVTSKPGSGTTVLARIPCSAAVPVAA